ncbi:hypothetical protein AYO47_02820 [Planctomyces sp. SCGC AG-212-M04]|nr:hypothetical protein AYO47_02820 [Planctomyces sp. SCGC AG-212-M04]
MGVGVSFARLEARLLRRSRASAFSGLVAFSCFVGGQFVSAADEPADPISKLGQRSAPQRWKDARTEWTGPTSRRERRQQIRHGGAPDAFSPDVAAPATTPPTDPGPSVVQERPARIDLTPVLTEPERDVPMFIAPPRGQTARRETAPDAPVPVELTRTAPAAPDSPEAPAAPEPEPTPLPEVVPEPVTEARTSERFAPEEPQAEAPVAARPPELKTIFDLPMREAPVETAFLPQIPRPPVSNSPTPAVPPTRLAPPPPPRLPSQGPFEVPRSEPSRNDLLVPPAPDEAPRVAGPVELPQLKKITEIQPFKSCSADGSGVKMCPPNTAGEGSDRCPEQQPLPVFDTSERNFIDIEYCWDAPNLFHTPLYFEDVELERYGHTYCEPIQTITSAAKFGGQLIGLPYQMALAPVHKREYPLGYYRAGDPAPYKCYQIPLNAEAALKAGYVYAGFSLLTP